MTQRSAPARARRPERARRDVDITKVLVAIVYGSAGVLAAYLFVVWRIAEQGLDVRGLVDVRLGPREWGYLTGFVLGATGLLALLTRNGRIEKLLGRDIPADRDEAARRAAATALADAAASEERTLAEVSRILAAAMKQVFDQAPPQASHQAELVEQLIDVLERQPPQPLRPLPPLPPVTPRRFGGRGQHRQATSTQPVVRLQDERGPADDQA